jgi:hypothetical protein
MQGFDEPSPVSTAKSVEQIESVATVRAAKRIFFRLQNQSLAGENGIANHTPKLGVCMILARHPESHASTLAVV